jgi:ferredoxin-type protein NapH
MIRSGRMAGLKHSFQNRGALAWALSAALIAFYVLLYFDYKVWPGGHLDEFAKRFFFFLPESAHPGKWTFYGFLYSAAIVAGGSFVIFKYRHNPYQVIRTSVVMFVQVSFGFSVPIILKIFNQPEYYFSYFWPLKFDYFQPSTIASQPLPFILYSFVGSLVLVPIMTLLYGKRWYCSWVCGCGGLANTFGEPWRHLSSKSMKAWKFEKYSIHFVLLLCLLTTSLYMLAAFKDLSSYPRFQYTAGFVKEYYGIVVIALLSGVFGTGLYPLGGTRVWCRNFCPMAAILGLIQKLGRFRIRVKKDMCISCGLCSKYCEMGIDVRSYAQANQNFVRAACVGCGMCAEVCPRGVLRLENASPMDPQEESFVDYIKRKELLLSSAK